MYLFLLTPKTIIFPILTFVLYILFNEVVRWNRRIKGLKGPPGLPIVGNLIDVSLS